MARMKFLCDAERCIECNGCVTACKNENEVPWGVNRRRVVTINDGVVGSEKIRTRGTADNVFVDLHLWVDSRTPLGEAHALSHVVKDRLMQRFPEVVDVVIHIEPPH